jgi:hypothetical protein
VASTASDFGCADPRSLLVGILVLAKPPLTPPDIIALGYALRLSATNIKSRLTRLSAEGVLIRTGSRRSQRYSLSAGRGRAIQEKCRRNGLLVSTEASTVLLLPSLAIEKRTAARGLDILARSI